MGQFPPPSNIHNPEVLSTFLPEHHIFLWILNYRRKVLHLGLVGAARTDELTQGLRDIPNFLRDLPQNIFNDAGWLEVALVQKYAPFVSENLFFDAYNGRTPFMEWFAKFRAHLDAIGCFNAFERAGRLRWRIEHLPCFVHVSPDDYDDFDVMRNLMRLYYDRASVRNSIVESGDELNPYYNHHTIADQETPPLSDRMPRYPHRPIPELSVTNMLDPNGQWLWEFDQYMEMTGCHLDEEKFLWLVRFLEEVPYPGRDEESGPSTYHVLKRSFRDYCRERARTGAREPTATHSGSGHGVHDTPMNASGSSTGRSALTQSLMQHTPVFPFPESEDPRPTSALVRAMLVQALDTTVNRAIERFDPSREEFDCVVWFRTFEQMVKDRGLPLLDWPEVLKAYMERPVYEVQLAFLDQIKNDYHELKNALIEEYTIHRIRVRLGRTPPDMGEIFEVELSPYQEEYNVVKWLVLFEEFCGDQHIVLNRKGEALRALLMTHNYKFMTTMMLETDSFVIMRDKLLDTFATPLLYRPDRYKTSVQPLKAILRSASRSEGVARVMNEDPLYTDRRQPVVERVQDNRNSPTLIIPFKPELIISEWFDCFERFLLASNVRSDLDKATTLRTYVRSGIPNFVAALPEEVTTSYIEFKAVLMERFMPLLDYYLFCNAYNGVDNVQDWLDIFERYLATLNYFDDERRTTCLRERIEHLPCYVHVSLVDQGKYLGLRDFLLLYYGEEYLPMGDGPFRDEFPRYHNRPNPDDEVLPYDGASNFSLWKGQFEGWMSFLWCLDDEDKVPYLYDKVKHLDFYGKLPRADLYTYPELVTILGSVYRQYTGHPIHLRTLAPRGARTVPGPPVSRAPEIASTSSFGFTEPRNVSSDRSRNEPQPISPPMPSPPIRAPAMAQNFWRLHPSRSRGLPMGPPPVVTISQPPPPPGLVLTPGQTRLYYYSGQPTDPVSLRPFTTAPTTQESRAAVSARARSWVRRGSRDDGTVPPLVRTDSTTVTASTSRPPINANIPLRPEIVFVSPTPSGRASTVTSPTPTSIRSSPDITLERQEEDEPMYENSTVELIEPDLEERPVSRTSSGEGPLPIFTDTEWARSRRDFPLPTVWVVIPRRIPSNWQISIPAARLGLITIIPTNVPEDSCLTPEFMRDQPVPPGWVQCELDILPCFLIMDWTTWTPETEFHYYHLGARVIELVRYPNERQASQISHARNALPPLIRQSIPFPPRKYYLDPKDRLAHELPEGELPQEEPCVYLLCPPLPLKYVIDLKYAALGQICVVPEGQPRIVRNSESLSYFQNPPPAWRKQYRDAEKERNPTLADTTVFIAPNPDHWLQDSLLLQLNLVTGRAMAYDGTADPAVAVREFPSFRPIYAPNDRNRILRLELIPRPISSINLSFNAITQEPGISVWSWPLVMTRGWDAEHEAAMRTTAQPPPTGWRHHWGPPPENLYSLVPELYDHYRRSQSGFLHRYDYLELRLPDNHWHWHHNPIPFASRILPPALANACPFSHHFERTPKPEDQGKPQFGFGRYQPRERPPFLATPATNGRSSAQGKTHRVKQESRLAAGSSLSSLTSGDPDSPEPIEHTDMTDATSADLFSDRGDTPQTIVEDSPPAAPEIIYYQSDEIPKTLSGHIQELQDNWSSAHRPKVTLAYQDLRKRTIPGWAFKDISFGEYTIVPDNYVWKDPKRCSMQPEDLVKYPAPFQWRYGRNAADQLVVVPMSLLGPPKCPTQRPIGHLWNNPYTHVWGLSSTALKREPPIGWRYFMNKKGDWSIIPVQLGNNDENHPKGLKPVSILTYPPPPGWAYFYNPDFTVLILPDPLNPPNNGMPDGTLPYPTHTIRIESTNLPEEPVYKPKVFSLIPHFLSLELPELDSSVETQGEPSAEYPTGVLATPSRPESAYRAIGARRRMGRSGPQPNLTILRSTGYSRRGLLAGSVIARPAVSTHATSSENRTVNIKPFPKTAMETAFVRQLRLKPSFYLYPDSTTVTLQADGMLPQVAKVMMPLVCRRETILYHPEYAQCIQRSIARRNQLSAGSNAAYVYNEQSPPGTPVDGCGPYLTRSCAGDQIAENNWLVRLDIGRIDPILSLQRLEQFALEKGIFSGLPLVLKGTHLEMWGKLYDKLRQYFPYLPTECQIDKFGSPTSRARPAQGPAFGPQGPYLDFNESIDFLTGTVNYDSSLARDSNGFVVQATQEEWHRAIAIAVGLGHQPSGVLGGITFVPRIVEFPNEFDFIEKWETAAISVGLLPESSRAENWIFHAGHYERSWNAVQIRIQSVLTHNVEQMYLVEPGSTWRVLWEPQEPLPGEERPILMAYTIATQHPVIVSPFKPKNPISGVPGTPGYISGVSYTRSRQIYPIDHNERGDSVLASPRKVTCTNCGRPNGIENAPITPTSDLRCSGCHRILSPASNQLEGRVNN